MSAQKPKKARRVTHEEASLSLSDQGALRLAIVADTHSHPHPKTAEWIAALSPDAILHAGDVGDLVVLDELARIAPVINWVPGGNRSAMADRTSRRSVSRKGKTDSGQIT